MRATPARKARDEKRRDELQSQIQEDKLVEFQMMCDDGEADGCFNLAEWHAVVNKDHAKAAQMYLHNCLTMSHGPSCHHAALMYSAFTRRAVVCQQYAHASCLHLAPVCSASVPLWWYDSQRPRSGSVTGRGDKVYAKGLPAGPPGWLCRCRHAWFACR